MSESDWLEIVIPASVANASDVAALIADEVAEAAQGTMLRGAEVVFWVSLERGEEALAQTRAVVANLAATGMAVDASGVTARPAQPESEWRDVWKRYFHVTRLTRQIVVVPSWETHAPADDDIVIHMDPGQAFGTGAHASTRLLLLELQALHDAGARVQRFLDVGTGSGILAIAAAQLWPESTGVAVDIDPLAVDATADNARSNGVAARIACSDTPLADIEGTFDLVLANIQANVIGALAGPLAARVGPGGYLLLSGLLSHQAEPVAARVVAADAQAGAHQGGDLTVRAVRPSEDDLEWSSARLERVPAGGSGA